eukprot:m.23634 g.23634  ORF g.23634 m.23634 type:complete len:71 (+) comp9527_c0_seq4:409-621(+)
MLWLLRGSWWMRWKCVGTDMKENDVNKQILQSANSNMHTPLEDKAAIQNTLSVNLQTKQEEEHFNKDKQK